MDGDDILCWWMMMLDDVDDDDDDGWWSWCMMIIDGDDRWWWMMMDDNGWFCSLGLVMSFVVFLVGSLTFLSLASFDCFHWSCDNIISNATCYI